jgi:shikimate kinase
MKIVYLLGVAGAGKTTLVRALTDRWQHRLDVDAPLAHQHWIAPALGRVVTLGRPAPIFAGTDTLSYTAINKAPHLLELLKQHDVNLVVGEGDRFANQRFIDLARELGDLHLFYLTAPPDVLADRRQQRATQHRLPPQNPRWIASRQTKHHDLATRNRATYLNATQPPATLATQLLDYLRLCRPDRV